MDSATSAVSKEFTRFQSTTKLTVTQGNNIGPAKRKRTTFNIEGEPTILSNITNVVPSASTQTQQPGLTPNLDGITANTYKRSSTTTTAGTKTHCQTEGNTCASNKKLKNNDSFYCKSCVLSLVLISMLFLALFNIRCS